MLLLNILMVVLTLDLVAQDMKEGQVRVSSLYHLGLLSLVKFWTLREVVLADIGIRLYFIMVFYTLYKSSRTNLIKRAILLVIMLMLTIKNVFLWLPYIIVIKMVSTVSEEIVGYADIVFAIIVALTLNSAFIGYYLSGVLIISLVILVFGKKRNLVEVPYLPVLGIPYSLIIILELGGLI